MYRTSGASNMSDHTTLRAGSCGACPALLSAPEFHNMASSGRTSLVPVRGTCSSNTVLSYHQVRMPTVQLKTSLHAQLQAKPTRAARLALGFTHAVKGCIVCLCPSWLG